jgi:4,5-DOPA dioxygenase extradiol
MIFLDSKIILSVFNRKFIVDKDVIFKISQVQSISKIIDNFSLSPKMPILLLGNGAWSVIKHLYPKADIPVVQMSIDYSQRARYHFELANQLQKLRERGVLVTGSGNVIDNLREVHFEKINEIGFGYDWAIKARAQINQFISDGDFQPLLHHETQGVARKKAIPTPDHFSPLIYALGLKGKEEDLSFFNDQLLAGSLSMTSV